MLSTREEGPKVSSPTKPETPIWTRYREEWAAIIPFDTMILVSLRLHDIEIHRKIALFGDRRTRNRSESNSAGEV